MNSAIQLPVIVTIIVVHIQGNAPPDNTIVNSNVKTVVIPAWLVFLHPVVLLVHTS